MKLTSVLKRVGLVATIALLLGIALPSASNAEPGRVLEINIDALTFADQNPTDLEDPGWCGPFCSDINVKVYEINGVSAGDTFTFNIENASNLNQFFIALIAYFKNGDGFSITYWKNDEEILFNTNPIESFQGYFAPGLTNLDNLKLQVTLGDNPDYQSIWSVNELLSGQVGFPSSANNEYFLFNLLSSGQWSDSIGGGPAPLTYGNSNSNSYADPTGELRSLINQIKGLSGNLIGWK